MKLKLELNYGKKNLTVKKNLFSSKKFRLKKIEMNTEKFNAKKCKIKLFLKNANMKV